MEHKYKLLRQFTKVGGTKCYFRLQSKSLQGHTKRFYLYVEMKLHEWQWLKGSWIFEKWVASNIKKKQRPLQIYFKELCGPAAMPYKLIDRMPIYGILWQWREQTVAENST